MQDISDFYLLDDSDQPVIIDGKNIIKARPETKTEQDLLRVIGLGKPDSIHEQFAAMVAAGEQWDWLSEYLDWIKVEEDITNFNNNLPQIGVDDFDNPVYADPIIIPPEPLRPPEKVVDDILDPLWLERRNAQVIDPEAYARSQALKSSIDPLIKAEGVALESAYFSSVLNSRQVYPKE